MDTPVPQTPCVAAQVPQVECLHVLSTVIHTRDVKFVFFPNSNFVCKIRILFELRLGLWYLVFSRTVW